MFERSHFPTADIAKDTKKLITVSPVTGFRLLYLCQDSDSGGVIINDLLG
jgi:hypothetical protein